MRKLIALLLLSTTASAGPFAELSLSAREHHNPAQPVLVPDWDAKYVSWINYSEYDAKTANPYGSVSVGYSWHLSDSVKASLSIRHESSIKTSDDRGINDIRLTLHWGD